MDELYLYGDSVHYSYSEQNHPDMMTSANHGSLPTPAVGYGSGISDADSISREVSRAVKAKIASHPLYPTLLQAYIDCQKVGALPEVAKMFDEIRGESNVCEITSTVVSPSFGDVDPELDHFMETYCDLLRKLKSDLSRPVDEAMVFLDRMRTQLGRLCDGSPHEEAPAGSSEEDFSSGSKMWTESFRISQELELKQTLLQKYRSYISNLKHECSKNKKKGKLPKESTQILLNWWNVHYQWPYPTESDKAVLAVSTGLDPKQINNWFINQRKRHWKPPQKNVRIATVVDGLYGPFIDE